MKFSTRDVDNDFKGSTESCAEERRGAWWFRYCSYSNLNGEYLGGHHNQPGKGLLWNNFKGRFYSYKIAEMKIGGDQN